jgi:hypothetical protein
VIGEFPTGEPIQESVPLPERGMTYRWCRYNLFLEDRRTDKDTTVSLGIRKTDFDRGKSYSVGGTTDPRVFCPGGCPPSMYRYEKSRLGLFLSARTKKLHVVGAFNVPNM